MRTKWNWRFALVVALCATASSRALAAPNLSVTWRVVDSGGGSIDSGGLYTAPGSGGQFRIEAVSVGNSSVVGSAVVSVGSTTATGSTLRVVGNQLQDTCGNKLVLRGIEMDMFWAPEQIQWIDWIAASGANAMRILVNHADMSWSDVDAVFAKATGKGMVFNWSIYSVPPGRGVTDYTDINYWNLPEVKALYQKYKKWIIVDAVQEYEGSDADWQNNALTRIKLLRSWGYDGPLDVLSNMSGRNLPTLLQYGAAVEAADPLHATIFGWQAYWFEEGHPEWSNGWTYQASYGMSLPEAIRQSSAQTFPIQMGIEKYTENNSVQYMDYSGAMAAAQQYGVGWLWWAWTGDAPWVNALTVNDRESTLSTVGEAVINNDSNGIRNTSRMACGR